MGNRRPDESGGRPGDGIRLPASDGSSRLLPREWRIQGAAASGSGDKKQRRNTGVYPSRYGENRVDSARISGTSKKRNETSRHRGKRTLLYQPLFPGYSSARQHRDSSKPPWR